MAETTHIAWTDATFNYVWGCVKVSAGCKFCYAETLDKRFGVSHWGPSAPRKAMSEKYWQQPVKWNRAAEKAGVRKKVFCSSMADVFEDRPGDPVIEPARARLFALIESTPHLIWQLLTKRPENMGRLAPAHWANGWPANVWAGTSVEDQENADKRIPELLKVPAAVHFLSCEPLLGPVDLLRVNMRGVGDACRWSDVLHGVSYFGDMQGDVDADGPKVDWVIIGGESGKGARACDVAWLRSLVEQCAAAEIACFVKQLGAKSVGFFPGINWKFRDKKGTDMSVWPTYLRVRQFPEAK